MSNGVKITEHFAQRIASTIRRVEAMPDATGSGKIPTRFEDRPIAAGGGGMSLGSYNTNGTQWEKGEATNVHVYEIETEEIDGETTYTMVPQYTNGVPVTVPVLNLFVTIPPNYDRVRYCAFSAVGGVNVLIVAEC